MAARTKLARTKTFTGCWTCRGRKIKCDLKRPHCGKCRKANVECEGYSIKLRWSSNGAAASTGATNEEDGFLQRRQIEFVEYPPGMMYGTYEDMDSHLASLHTPVFDGEETISQGPFGVFEGVRGMARKRARRKGLTASLNNSNTSSILFDMTSLNENSPDVGLISNLSNASQESPTISTDTPDLEFMDPLLTAEDRNNTTDDFSLETGAVNQNLVLRSPLFQLMAPETVGSLPIPVSRRALTAEAHLLLTHYIETVAPLMSVARFDNNPWKIIYLPRAFAAISDICVSGTTSYARHAVLHALLAVSAFHMSAKLADTDREFLYNKGLQLKALAYASMAQCLTIPVENHQKYKDLLVAILSMVSIDVTAGSMRDCRVHLTACQSVINRRYIDRPKISKKAAILHRIAGFLKILQDATTVVASVTENVPRDSDIDRWLDLNLDDYDQNKSSDVTSPSTFFNDIDQFQEYWIEQSNKVSLDSLPDDFYSRELVMSFSLYGIPDSLILLFSQVVNVSRQTFFYRLSGESLPYSLVQSCYDVESSLISWKNRYKFDHSNSPFTGEMHEVMCLHTLAFHRSLVIYYARLARNVDPKTIQDNVSEVLGYLEELQALNRKHNAPLAIPLIFPAFIAACEAVKDDRNSVDLQGRFDAWLDQMSLEGLGTYYAAREVIQEVWNRRDIGSQPADWWGVIRERDINLMLS